MFGRVFFSYCTLLCNGQTPHSVAEGTCLSHLSPTSMCEVWRQNKVAFKPRGEDATPTKEERKRCVNGQVELSIFPSSCKSTFFDSSAERHNGQSKYRKSKGKGRIETMN